ncbi:MAG TPA: ATP-dependent DNA helicase RecG [Steroidobacteraceae bacterium]|nr:ATP-dependent DNA helicase RecG [Steroidobacteraceae bacterium]
MTDDEHPPRSAAVGASREAGLAGTPVATLRGVGPALAAKLARIGLHTVQDILFHLPLRYEDRTRVVPVGGLRAGRRAVVEGEIQLAEVVFRRRRALLCRVADGSGFLTLRFFHFSAAQQAALVRGKRLRCFGEVRLGPAGLEMVHPEYRRVGAAETPTGLESLTPVYPATEGVQQGRLRMLSDLALKQLDSGSLLECVPAEALQHCDLPPLEAALRYAHRPPSDSDIELLNSGRHPAQRRLAFEELLAHQLSLRQLRQAADKEHSWPLPAAGDLVARCLASLPFELTAAQARAWAEIETDLARAQPMMRLVQGDVGSGKTVVAALAALRAVENGLQAAVMAPTELLAEQHARSFVGWLEPLGVRIALLTGKQPVKTRNALTEDLAGGAIQVAVGTHALFQQHVKFDRLGMIVVDEQHRFGVHQRLELREKGRTDGRCPHQLVMTATPIPRTLAMTAYADLDVSIIDELPPGRTPVRTVALPETRRHEVVARVEAACRAGRQAYWVCPLVDESEVLRHQAAEETAAALAAALPDLRIGLVHGRMPGRRKETVMNAFKQGRLDLLVATTVIEVGVDVPNASLMIIENSERMGLAQLHQLRGRVGRGSVESSCVLLYSPPLSELARERLAVLRETSDGFEVARRDLELRGPGELLGTRQTGLMQLKVADLVRDADLLPAVQLAADLMLDGPAANIAALQRRWVGDGKRFGKV